MDKTNKTPDFLSFATKIKGNAARYAAGEAKKFFKECFVKGGWTGASFQAWKARKSPVGRKLMYNEGSLMNSIRTFRQTDDLVETGTTAVQSEIHNDGGVITVTPRMKKFFWAKYYEIAGTRKKNAGTIAEFYRRMALMPVGRQIKIPKRQFIGESETFMQQLDMWLQSTIETSSKNDLNTD